MSEQKAKIEAHPDFFTDISHRDWLAGMAMQGYIASAEWRDTDVPKYAYRMADKMIKDSND